MDMQLFYILLALVAFLYASVGHGGASGYLALMAIWGFAPDLMKPTALLLNLFVAAMAFFQYYRGGHFRWKLFLPMAIASVPMAYFGGTIGLEDAVYKRILGLLLLIPIARFFFFAKADDHPNKASNTVGLVIIGSAIGLLSGLIGIGGGILLSPILLLLRWSNQKEAAAVSALFIFVNSVAGLLGQWSKGLHFSSDMVLMVLIAFAGGCFGSWLGSMKFKQSVLRVVLASVLCLASYKLLFTTA